MHGRLGSPPSPGDKSPATIDEALGASPVAGTCGVVLHTRPRNAQVGDLLCHLAAIWRGVQPTLSLAFSVALYSNSRLFMNQGRTQGMEGLLNKYFSTKRCNKHYACASKRVALTLCLPEGAFASTTKTDPVAWVSAPSYTYLLLNLVSPSGIHQAVAVSHA